MQNIQNARYLLHGCKTVIKMVSVLQSFNLSNISDSNPVSYLLSSDDGNITHPEEEKTVL